MKIRDPKIYKEVRSFLGMASWYRWCVPNLSTLVSPFYQLTRKTMKFQWSEDCKNAFHRLKKCLILAPILTCPDFTQPFVGQTKASAYGANQTLDGEERVICYLSPSLSQSERNYHTTDRECLAAVWAMEKLRPYLEGTAFTVISDHHALPWLMNFSQATGKLCRWAIRLQ